MILIELTEKPNAYLQGIMSACTILNIPYNNVKVNGPPLNNILDYGNYLWIYATDNFIKQTNIPSRASCPVININNGELSNHSFSSVPLEEGYDSAFLKNLKISSKYKIDYLYVGYDGCPINRSNQNAIIGPIYKLDEQANFLSVGRNTPKEIIGNYILNSTNIIDSFGFENEILAIKTHATTPYNLYDAKGQELKLQPKTLQPFTEILKQHEYILSQKLS